MVRWDIANTEIYKHKDGETKELWEFAFKSDNKTFGMYGDLFGVIVFWRMWSDRNVEATRKWLDKAIDFLYITKEDEENFIEDHQNCFENKDEELMVRNIMKALIGTKLW